MALPPPKRWYSPQPAPWSIRPLAFLFRLIADFRRARHRRFAAQNRLPVPVVVVGNITVGGTGKTPVVMWLVEQLRAAGFKPGVISRGYGGRSLTWPRRVTVDADPAEVGDEPVLIAKACACPMAVGPDRLMAARMLLQHNDVDVIVSDDGLQHYRLWRDLEIAVVDSSRGLGNGQLLPAGPLREPPSRLQQVDLVVVNGPGWTPPAVVPMVRFQMTLTGVRALDGSGKRTLADFSGQTVHAIAGIGNPARFFSALSQKGIHLTMHPFADHHAYKPQDLAFGDDLPVLMTEKDAVKCRRFSAPHHWVVTAEPRFSAEDTTLVQELIKRLRP